MYYTIQNGQILTAENRDALSKYYDSVQLLPADYVISKYVVENNQLVLNPNYEAELEKQERERISKLSLTKREVFLNLYQAVGITPEQIKAQITDPSVLIEFEYANEYYRGNPLINLIGNSLGFSSEELDYLFKFKRFPTKEVIDNA